MDTKRILYCPHKGEPVFMNGYPKNFRIDDFLSISENLTVLYNITQTTPNLFLSKYGGILTNIPGDAVIGYEDDEEIKDIPLDILDNFSEIVRKDEEARISFSSSIQKYGDVFTI